MALGTNERNVAGKIATDAHVDDDRWRLGEGKGNVPDQISTVHRPER